MDNAIDTILPESQRQQIVFRTWHARRLRLSDAWQFVVYIKKFTLAPCWKGKVENSFVYFCLWDKMLNVSSSECWPSDGRLAEWLRPPRPLQQKCPLIKYSVFVSILNFLSSTNWNWKTLIFYKEQTQLWEKIKSLLNYYTYLIVRPVNEITDYLCFAKFLFFAIFYTSTSPRHHYIIHYHYFKAISASSIT